ncbi:MAG: CheR family methyltransferase [Planctomycetota bacterium]
MLKRLHGFVIRAHRLSMLTQAIDNWRADLGIDDDTSIITRLEHDPTARQNLLERMTVHESYFLRDRVQLDNLIDRLATSGQAGQPRRIWCAGCASGEEPYTLAILCANRFPLNIIATDISHQALARARHGSYRAAALRDCPDDFRKRHFQVVNDTWHIKPAYREHIRFLHHDLSAPLAADFYGTGFDAILCRNVLIYLSAEQLPAIASRFHDALRPGGWLLTAASDPSLDRLAPWRTHVEPLGMSYQRLDPAAKPRLETTAKAHVPPPRPRQVDDRRDSDQALNEALAAIEAGDHDRAMTALRRCLYLRRDQVLAHYLQGMLFQAGGDNEQAVRCYQRVLSHGCSLDPACHVGPGDDDTAGAIVTAAEQALRAFGKAT